MQEEEEEQTNKYQQRHPHSDKFTSEEGSNDAHQAKVFHEKKKINSKYDSLFVTLVPNSTTRCSNVHNARASFRFDQQ